MTVRLRNSWCLSALTLCCLFVRPAYAEQTVDLVGNVYCRSSADAGERPWGGVRVFVKGKPSTFGDSDPEHGRYRLTLPVGEVLGRKLTLVFAQSNLMLSEEEHEVAGDDTLILSGQPTAQMAPKVFVVPYCTELQTPKLREMVRSLVDQISHRAALVHEELVRAHRFGNPETANCLDDVLSRMGAHLRHAESRVPYFMDALGSDGVRARREVNAIKIADERSLELANEANYCLEHHAPNPGDDSSRYLPDLSVSPAGFFANGTDGNEQAVPWNRPRPAEAVAPPEERLVWVYGASFETGYDTNFLQRQSSRAIPGWQFRPSSFVSLKYFDPERLAATPNTELTEPSYDVNLGLSGILLTATEGGTGGLSQYSDLGITANAVARFAGKSPFSGTLLGQYVRRVEPFNEPEHQFTYGQNDLRVGGEFAVRMGEGRFELGAGYLLGAALHDSAEQSQYDRLDHRLSVFERLRFLPETAFVHETEYRIRAFSNATALHDSGQLRSRLGILGMIGERLGFQLMLGWAQSDYTSSAVGVTNFDGPLAMGKLEWFFGPVAKTAYGPNVLVRPSLSLVFDRDYRDNVVTDYYTRDRGSIQLALTNGTRAMWLLQGGLSRVTYPFFVNQASVGGPLVPGAVIGNDAEYRVGVSTALEYGVYDGLRITGRFELSENLSDVVPILADGSPTSASLGFVRYQVLGGVLYSR